MKKLTPAEIEHIITYEVIVDCYEDHEVNMGWAIFMSEGLNFPFEAEYQVRRKGKAAEWQKVQVVGNETDESNYEGGEFYVLVEVNEMEVPVAISKLRNIQADEETMRTLQVWEYENQ